jgi:hypothetical protein
MQKTILPILLLLLPLGLWAQKPPTQRTFEFSVRSDWFEFLNKAYPTSLLDACGGDLEQSFQKWGKMLHEMELYGQEIGFDIRGLKIWLKVFFRADGTPDYIAYSPKPGSVVFQEAELNAFFNGFMKRYKMEIAPGSAYAHYGGASFPTFIGYPAAPDGAPDNGKQ